MNDYIQKILHQMAPLKPPRVTAYASDKMAIFKANIVFNDSRAFDDYQFLLATKEFPPVTIDKKKSVLDNNKNFVINPYQALRPNTEEVVSVPNYYPMFIDKSFFQELANDILGKRTIYFENNPFELTKETTQLVSSYIQEASQQSTNRLPFCIGKPCHTHYRKPFKRVEK